VSDPKCDAGSRCEMESYARSGFSAFAPPKARNFNRAAAENFWKIFFHGLSTFHPLFTLM